MVLVFSSFSLLGSFNRFLKKLSSFERFVEEKNLRQMNPFSILPQDVILYFLNLLPDKLILRLRSLDKRWKFLTDSEILWKLRTNEKYPSNVPEPTKTWKEFYFDLGRRFTWNTEDIPTLFLVDPTMVSSGGGYGSPGIVLTKQKLAKGINRIRISILKELNWTYLGVAKSSAVSKIGTYPQTYPDAWVFKSHHNHNFIELYNNNISIANVTEKHYGLNDVVCLTADLKKSTLRIEVEGKTFPIFLESRVEFENDDWHFCCAFNSNENSIQILPPKA